MQRSLRLALATVQFDEVHSGPGTFARYLVENELERITFLSKDIQCPGPRRRRVEFQSFKGWPGGQFVRSWAYHRAFLQEYDDHVFDLLWYNGSPKTGFFSAVLPLPVPVVLMVNDYNNAISRWPLDSRKELGLRRSIKRPVWRFFEKWVLHAADAVVVNSQFMQRKISTSYGLPSEKIHLLYKAVDASQFAFKPERSFEEPIRVLFVKNDYVRGGLEEVLAALSDVPFSTQLTVAGPGKGAATAIRAMARKNGYTGALHLCGRVVRERIKTFLQDHDVFCVPSRAEALGVAFMEALASGLPAVGSRVGGIPEVLDEGRAGWLAEPLRPESVRAQLRSVVENETERRQRVEHGREHVQRFSVQRMVQRFSEIAADVVA